jgi:hypothetical protein
VRREQLPLAQQQLRKLLQRDLNHKEAKELLQNINAP